MSRRPAGEETRCNFCGDPTTDYHSGSYECRACWSWRKLDGPAARYWVERIESLFERGPDGYDFMRFFPQTGVTTEEINAAFDTLERIHAYSRAQIEAHRR